MAKIVIALGGNALGNTPEEQLKLITGTATSIVDLIEQGNDSLTITSDGRPIAELRPIRRRTRTAPPPRHPVRRDPEFTAETARNNQRVLAQMMENSR